MSAIISKWRGDEKICTVDDCHHLWSERCDCPKNQYPDYSSPLAWDEDLYREIEERGIWPEFQKRLCLKARDDYWEKQERDGKAGNWYDEYIQLRNVIKATPEQKTIALERAIEESEG
jgi:hypothetical protein